MPKQLIYSASLECRPASHHHRNWYNSITAEICVNTLQFKMSHQKRLNFQQKQKKKGDLDME